MELEAGFRPLDRRRASLAVLQNVDELGVRINVATITLTLDEDDERTIQAAIAEYQRRHHAAFGETILPEGESCMAGAIIAELVRDLNEYRDLWNAEHEDGREL